MKKLSNREVRQALLGLVRGGQVGEPRYSQGGAGLCGVGWHYNADQGVLHTHGGTDSGGTRFFGSVDPNG